MLAARAHVARDIAQRAGTRTTSTSPAGGAQACPGKTTLAETLTTGAPGALSHESAQEPGASLDGRESTGGVSENCVAHGGSSPPTHSHVMKL
eukprot:7565845-Alexandrium_andersonii.AAC.1